MSSKIAKSTGRPEPARAETLISRALRVSPSEVGRVAIMALYAAAAIGGVATVGYAVGEALFLSRLPSTDTPYLFILPAISNVLVLLLYGAVLARVRLQRVAVASSLLLAIVVVVFRVLLSGGAGQSFGVLGALYLLVDICAVLSAVQFWTFAGQVFNAREARRLFGLIAAGGTLSNVVAGLSMAALVRHAGIENLLFIVCGSLVVCALCATRLGRHRPDIAGPRADDTADSSSMALAIRAVIGIPLLRAIAGLTILSAMLINLGYYQFYLALQTNFAGQGRSMVVFLGAFQSIAGVAALAMQLLVTSAVMRRLGIIVALLFYPIGLAIGGTAVLVSGGTLIAAAVIQGCLPVFQQTINESAFNVLYIPLPTGLRKQARNIMQILFSVVFGLAGVLFLLFQHIPAWRYYYWSVPLLALSAIALGLVLWTGRPYARALAASVSRRRFDRAVSLNIADETSVRAVAQILRDADALKVLHTLSLIDGQTGVDWDPWVAPLLDHQSADVREAALKHLGRPGNTAQMERVSAFIDAPEYAVRAAAISAYCTIAGLAAGARVSAFLGDRNPRVRGAAVAGLIPHVGSDTDSGRPVSPLRQPRGARNRTLAMPRVPVGEQLRAMLPELLKDPDVLVRCAAIRAAGALGNQEFVPYLIRALGRRATAQTAIHALADFGGPVIPALAAVLEQGEGDRHGRAEVPRVLDRIGTPAAARLLLAHVQDPDERTRTAVHRALAAMRSRALEFPLPAATLRTALLGELGDYYGLYLGRAALRGDGDDPLLGDTFTTRMDRDLARVFYLLEAMYPGKRLERVREVLDDPLHRSRAGATELLDTTVDHEIGEVLLPLLESADEGIRHVAAKRFGLIPRSPRDLLIDLANSGDPWLRSCAIIRIGADTHRDLLHLVTEGLHADYPLVREASLLASRQLLTPPLYRQLLAHHARDSRFPSVSRLAQSRLDERTAG